MSKWRRDRFTTTRRNRRPQAALSGRRLTCEPLEDRMCLSATLLSVTPNLLSITDANVGSQTFTLTESFSEAMNTAVNPAIGFPTAGEDPTILPATLAFHSGNWISNTLYVASYDVADHDVRIPNIDVSVDDAQDSGGATVADTTVADVFGVDTLEPKVVSLHAELDDDRRRQRGDRDLHAHRRLQRGDEHVAEPLDHLPDRRPVPDGEPPATLTLQSGAWTNDTTYVATYDVADRNLAMPTVDVSVSGTQDPAGRCRSPTRRLVFSPSTRRTRRSPASRRAWRRSATPTRETRDSRSPWCSASR